MRRPPRDQADDADDDRRVPRAAGELLPVRPVLIGCMSAFGTKRTYACAPHMAAFGGKADMRWAVRMSAFDPKRTYDVLHAHRYS
jgi:hypothetical protein